MPVSKNRTRHRLKSKPFFRQVYAEISAPAELGRIFRIVPQLSFERLARYILVQTTKSNSHYTQPWRFYLSHSQQLLELPPFIIGLVQVRNLLYVLVSPGFLGSIMYTTTKRILTSCLVVVGRDTAPAGTFLELRRFCDPHGVLLTSSC